MSRKRKKQHYNPAKRAEFLKNKELNRCSHPEVALFELSFGTFCNECQNLIKRK